MYINTTCLRSSIKQEAQLSLTKKLKGAMLVYKVVEVWQDFLSE